MHPERACTIIAACVVLHNICIEKRIPIPGHDNQDLPAVPVPDHPAAVPEDVAGRLVRTRIINML